jgi:predicted metal-dependent hydrolase
MGRADLKRASSEEVRRIELGGRSLEYLLRRSARRTLGLQVAPRGVRVSVPHRAPLWQVEAFLRDHADWVHGKLGELERAAASPRPDGYALVDGASLPLLGEAVRLRLVAGMRRPAWRRAADGVEELHLPQAAAATAAVRALRARALLWFAERVAEYCAALGESVPALRLTNARTRWGSCSRASGIRLHWRLIHLPPALIDYVVAHEVAHLREMNHSPRFWALVEALCPGAAKARRELRATARCLPVIDTAA